MKTAKTWETWKNQVAILGITAIVIIGIAMMIFPSIQGNITGKPYRLELTAYFYDPLAPNPTSLLQAAIQAAKRPAALSDATEQPSPAPTVFEARYDSALSLLHVVVGAEDEAKAKAAAKAALDAIVLTYTALPARQAALTAYLAARDYGTIKLLGRAVSLTAAASVPIAASIVEEKEKTGSASMVEFFLMIGLAALVGLLAILAPRGGSASRKSQAKAEAEVISLQEPKPSAR